MKKRHLIYAITLIAGMGTCAASAKKQAETGLGVRKSYNIGTILFEDKASETRGSDIYHRTIPDVGSYIKEQTHTVLATLHNSLEDNVTPMNKTHYTLEGIEGISTKGGGNGDVTIFYSTWRIEKSFVENDTAKLFSKTRGVLLYELTHVYQPGSQGIGSYGTNHVSWAFVEGMADAVRVANGGFDGPNARPKGGNYTDGYWTVGYFFVWLRDNKDPEFPRKFNRSTLEAIPWSFDGTIKYILGTEYSIDELWHEYQVAVGDVQV